MGQVKTTRTWRASSLQGRVGEAASQTAEKDAAQIPWPQLHVAREKYVECEAFALWVRAIEDAEGDVPGWLAEAVEKRCPNFLKFVVKHKQEHPECPPFFRYHLERWINERIFGKVWRQGWMNALGYYATRDLAMNKVLRTGKITRPAQIFSCGLAGGVRRS